MRSEHAEVKTQSYQVRGYLSPPPPFGRGRGRGPRQKMYPAVELDWSRCNECLFKPTIGYIPAAATSSSSSVNETINLKQRVQSWGYPADSCICSFHILHFYTTLCSCQLQGD